MPLVRTYSCVVCAHVVTTAFESVPLHCAKPMKWRQTRDYKPEEHGWSTGMKSAAIGFRHTSPWMVPLADGSVPGQVEIPVESLRQVRHLENESAKRAADGLGQEIRFRAFNQNVKGGGMLENSFGPAPIRTPKLFDDEGRPKITLDAVDGETVDLLDMGPGAREELASALGPGMMPADE